MRIGIDLGGTKTEGVVMDASGSILLRERRPTPRESGYQAIIDDICALVRDLETDVGTSCRVGVGTPGSISARTGLLKNSNTVCLNDRPIKEDLERRLGRTIRIENDANCFTLSEAMDGAARDYEVVFGVIMGTGVGGGIVCRKRLHAGPQHIAGEWGHNTLIAGGRNCYCGRRGCVEAYLSGPGLVHDWRAEVDDSTISAEEIMRRADAGEPASERVVQRFLDRFGQALAQVINILDPDAIVLGGGLSNVHRLYTEGRERVARYVFNDELRTPILRHVHGDSSGVRGAAQLWPE